MVKQLTGGHLARSFMKCSLVFHHSTQKTDRSFTRISKQALQSSTFLSWEKMQLIFAPSCWLKTLKIGLEAVKVMLSKLKIIHGFNALIGIKLRVNSFLLLIVPNWIRRLTPNISHQNLQTCNSVLLIERTYLPHLLITSLAFPTTQLTAFRKTATTPRIKWISELYLFVHAFNLGKYY
jgi:hypothetical protein